MGKGQEATGSRPTDALTFLVLREGATLRMVSFRNLTRQWKGLSSGVGRSQTMLREHASAAGDSQFQTIGKCHFCAQKRRHPYVQGLRALSLHLQSWTPKQGDGKVKSLGFWGSTVGTGVWYNSSTQLCTEAGSRKRQPGPFPQGLPVQCPLSPSAAGSSACGFSLTPSSGKPNEQEQVMSKEAIPSAQVPPSAVFWIPSTTLSAFT